MKAFLLGAILLLPSSVAQAGAWTQAEDHWQVITGIWASDADTGFDTHGRARVPVHFQKAMLETASEYGWEDWLTLIFNSETVYAVAANAPRPTVRAVDNAFEGGARLRLDDSFGVLSVQASYRTAGAFNFALSADSKVAGSAAELRLLYGTSFQWAGHDGFFDLQAAERFISAPRPDETPIDITAGLWLTPNWLVLAQSFNIVSGGDAQLPYRYYRSHKLQASLVRRLSDRFLLQAGAFFSPLGQNALVERGFGVSVWLQA